MLIVNLFLEFLNCEKFRNLTCFISNSNSDRLNTLSINNKYLIIKID